MSNERLSDYLASFDPKLPLSQARSLPASWYTDSNFAKIENEFVFNQTWQFVGHESRWSEPGSYVQLRLGNERLIVARNSKGELNAFYDVCRHKAASVVAEECGVAQKFRCRYHGWTYNLDGALIGTPDFREVEDFKLEEQGLPKVQFAEHAGLVFVHLGEFQETLSEYLSPLESSLKEMALSPFKFYDRKVYDLECNWKVFIDNYLDGGYHINTVHPALSGVLDYSGYHTVCDAFTALQKSPIKNTGSDIGAVRTGNNAFYWWVYPNLMLNVYEGVLDTNWVVPLGVNRCRVIFDYYFYPDKWEYASQSVEVAHKVQLEDEGVCREVQLGLQSRSYHQGRFSVKREPAAYYFHQLLHQQLEEYSHAP